MTHSLHGRRALAVRLGVLSAGAVAAAIVLPSAASAAVVSEAGGIVTYQAAPGEVNQVQPLTQNGFVRVREINGGTPLTAGVGCAIVSPGTAQCGGPGARVVVNLGDRNDTYFGTGPGFVPTLVNGDAGNDTLIDGNGTARREVYNGGAGTDTAAYFLATATVRLSLDGLANDGETGENDVIGNDVENLEGGSAADRLVGNTGINHLRGNGGPDILSGLDGSDIFDEGPSSSGADTMIGGPGLDRAVYSERTTGAVRVRLDGAANDGQAGEGDNVQADVEAVTGTQFADTLIGNSGQNRFSGIGGNDSINPLAGQDAVFGGDGGDTIELRDGERDSASGGAGVDTIRRDAIDVITG